MFIFIDMFLYIDYVFDTMYVFTNMFIYIDDVFDTMIVFIDMLKYIDTLFDTMFVLIDMFLYDFSIRTDTFIHGEDDETSMIIPSVLLIRLGTNTFLC